MVVNSVASFTTYGLTSRFQVFEQKSESKNRQFQLLQNPQKNRWQGSWKNLGKRVDGGYLGAQPNVFKTLENRGIYQNWVFDFLMSMVIYMYIYILEPHIFWFLITMVIYRNPGTIWFWDHHGTIWKDQV
jgi:hypothetical protein